MNGRSTGAGEGSSMTTREYFSRAAKMGRMADSASDSAPAQSAPQ